MQVVMKELGEGKLESLQQHFVEEHDKLMIISNCIKLASAEIARVGGNLKEILAPIHEIYTEQSFGKAYKVFSNQISNILEHLEKFSFVTEEILVQPLDEFIRKYWEAYTKILGEQSNIIDSIQVRIKNLQSSRTQLAMLRGDEANKKHNKKQILELREEINLLGIGLNCFIEDYQHRYSNNIIQLVQSEENRVDFSLQLIKKMSDLLSGIQISFPGLLEVLKSVNSFNDIELVFNPSELINMPLFEKAEVDEELASGKISESSKWLQTCSISSAESVYSEEHGEGVTLPAEDEAFLKSTVETLIKGVTINKIWLQGY